MKQTIPIYNPGPGIKFVGARMIPAGETAVFEPHELPPGYQNYQPQNGAAPAEQENVKTQVAPHPMQALSDADHRQVLATIPTLDDEQLKGLEDLEKARGKKIRKSVLEAIAEQRLANAKERQIDERMAEFRASLVEFKTEELQQMLEGYQDGNPEKAVIEQVIQEREADAE